MGRPMSDSPATCAAAPPRGRSAAAAAGARARGARALARARRVRASRCALRAGAEQWVFYEGPPTANGPPGSHHVLSRVFKDIYPRFQTMRGYRVERKGGWDCHGLPVEIAVEQKLGITSKAEIEETIGIERFNAECRASVFAFLRGVEPADRADRLLARPRARLPHARRELHRVGVVGAGADRRARAAVRGPQGRALLPALRDDALLARGRARLPGRGRPERLPEAARARGRRTRLLVWTTTPWTLPGQRGRGGVPDARPTRARAWARRCYVLAEDRVEAVLGEDAEILERFSGSELVERYGAYEGPIFAASDREPRAAADPRRRLRDDRGRHRHRAPRAGLRRGRLPRRGGRAAGPVRPDAAPARCTTRSAPTAPTTSASSTATGARYEGRFVKDAELTGELIEDLRERGLLLRVAGLRALLPALLALRATPLLYYAKPSWYIATSRLREELLAANETVDWHPPHVKHGRFGDWLTNNVDWALSRERYWGTPLPVWRCEQRPRPRGRLLRRARRALAARELADHHRPYVDDVGFPCPHEDGGGACGEPMRRVPEVIDVWFDSGAMPFAQHHFPFENRGACSSRASRRTSSARPRTRRAAGSTRCWRSRRCSSARRPTATSSAWG